jgi:isoquinoline 1-oxidoreductase beta subunit
VAVVGKTTWHAQQGALALNVQWKDPEGPPVNSATILESLEGAARSGGGFTFFAQGDADAALASAPKALEAVYRAPYLAHAAMEPINCTAQVKDGKVTVWASTQSPQMARGLAAKLAGVAVEQVTLNVTYLGGGFGRRLDIDMVGQAVTVALQTQGKPVQVIWSREEDLRHDFYRPASVALLRATLGPDGLPAALTIQSAGDAPAPRWMERALVSELPVAAAALASGGDLRVPSALQPVLAATAGATMTPDKTAAEGLFDLPYAIAHQRMRHAATRSGVPVGFWRSVGHSHHAFFSESFIDELAAQAGKDPVAYRLAMLSDMPRYAAVLRLAADKAGWGTPLPPGVARGVALHESFGSIVAEVVEASITDGQIRVHRVVVAIDAGTVVNPGIVAQQMESGVVFGLTAALYGRIDITNGEVEQGNFPSYRLLSLADAPRIETHIVPSETPPTGVGEPGVPPLAPAVAGAVFALTGRRLRELPLRLA